MQGLFLLTMKPVTYAANVAEGDLGDQVFASFLHADPVARSVGRQSCWQTLMRRAVFAPDTATMRRLRDRWLQGAQNTHVQALRQKAEQEGRQVVIVSAQVWNCNDADSH